MNNSTDQNHLLGFLWRRRYALAAAVFVAAGGAYVAANKFSGESWSCTATLLYNRSALGEPHYRQPEAQSIVSLFKSRSALETLADEFKLPPHLAALASSIQAEIIYGSNTIQLTMRGGDPQRTKAMLDRLVQIVVNQAAQLRRDAVTHILEDRSKNLTEAKLTVDRAFRNLDRFHAAHRIVTEVDDDLDRIRDDIAAVERAAEVDRPSVLDPQEELQRRRTAMQEHLTLQRETIARDSALALKKNEYDRAARLHEKRYISDAEYRRVETEYRALEAQNAESLRTWQQRLSQVDQKLNERLERQAGDGTNETPKNNPQQTVAAARLEAFLAQRRAEAERLSVLRGQEADLKQAVVTTQAEVQRLSALVAMFQDFRNAAFDDLTIVQPAAPALDPVSSNKKKVMAGAFLALLGLCITPMIAWDAMRGIARATTKRNDAAQATATAAATTRGATNRHETIRTLALRIQQLPTQQGAVILLNSLDDVAPPIDAALEAAECLHRRGEKVLVVDVSGRAGVTAKLCDRTTAPAAAAINVVDEWIHSTNRQRVYTEFAGGDDVGSVATAVAAPINAGLADWLLDEQLEIEQVVRRGRSFDALTLGEAALPEEAFAERRLTIVLDELRRRYSDVLVLGPGVERQVDLELLAARVDGVAFVTAASRPSLPAGERAWASLAALKAPLLGRFDI